MISDDWEWYLMIGKLSIWKRDDGEDYRIWVFVGKWVLKIKQLLNLEKYFSSSVKNYFIFLFLWNLSFVSLSPSARPWGWKLLSHDEEYSGGDGGYDAQTRCDDIDGKNNDDGNGDADEENDDNDNGDGGCTCMWVFGRLASGLPPPSLGLYLILKTDAQYS